MKKQILRASTCLLLAMVLIVSSCQVEAQKADNFAKENLHAWAFELFDKDRSPEERAQLLKRVGFTKIGFVVNGKLVDQFDAHVGAYKKAGIEIVSVWWQSSNENLLTEAKTQTILATLDKHGLKPQIWFSMGKDAVASMPEDERLGRAVKMIRPLAREARKRGVQLALYNHMEWFGETDNQIAIIERLRSEGDMDHVGMVYNFHHGHDRILNFDTVFEKMQPYLIALNLNGMKVEGPKIIHIGEGDREQAMLKTVIDSGYKGPIGVIHHFSDKDAEMVYRKNLNGLKNMLTKLGYGDIAETY